MLEPLKEQEIQHLLNQARDSLRKANMLMFISISEWQVSLDLLQKLLNKVHTKKEVVFPLLFFVNISRLLVLFLGCNDDSRLLLKRV